MKSYYRYRPSEVVGVITTPDCKAVYDYTGKLVFTSKIQEVGIWNVRQGNQVKSLSYEDNNYPHGARGEVSTLTRSGDQKSICVGYTTGEVRVFNYITGAITATYRGHRSAVTTIALDGGASQNGTLLATGGADCDIVIWDQVASQGLVRFREHKDAVTALAFLEDDERKFLISVSKDTLLKVWDVENKYCLQTIVGHRSEIWSLAISYQSPENADRIRVFTGAGDEKIRAYALRSKVLEDANNAVNNEEVLIYVGAINRTTNAGGHVDRCASLTVHAEGQLLAAQSAGKIVEIFHLRSKDEIKRRIKKRRKRELEQQTGSNNSILKKDADGIALDTNATDEDDNHGPILTDFQLSDEIDALHILRSSVKIRSFEFSPVPKTANEDFVAAMIALNNNSLEMYKVPLERTPVGVTKTSVVDFAGHRNDIRGVCVSQDGNYVATCSAEAIKLWNARSMACVSTCNVPLATQFCLCIAFAPGGRFIIAGFKDGSIQIFDTASGESVYNFSPDQLADAANNSNTNGAIYAIAVRPDGTGFVAGGADKTARFFRFLLANTKGDAVPQGLQAQCTREMSLPSELLNVTYSFHKGGPSSNSSRSPLLVCMALLDHTVRILYDDTLRLCLTLYGHSLPVLCVDISSDNMLVATGSADKTLKLWGLDFGDCHRSLFGHSDTVTTVQFVRHTHYLFSGSKDGSIRYWDGDRFEQILYLPGHKGTIWSLGVGLEGAFVFSAGQDRSLRRWMRDTDDLCFVEEEKERALEGQVDQQALVVSSAANSGMVVVLENDTSGAGNPAETSVAAAAATTSLVAVKGGDLLMQTLDYLEEEIPFSSLESLDASNPTLHTELVSAIQRPSTNPYLLGLSPVKYFQRCVSSQIPRSDLEAALLLLPMTYIVRFICWLEVLCDFGSASEIETATRCLVTLLLCHTRALTSQSTVLLPHLLRLRTLVTERMDSFKTMLGMNQAAFHFVQRQIETDEEDKQALQQAMYVDPMLSLSGKETKEQPKKKQRHA